MASISSITHAENSKRKSHRLNIPVQAIISNYTYQVTDWSMNGLKVEIDNNINKNTFSINDILDIKIILPTGNSSILLDMSITVRSIQSNSYGMEITTINDKNKRVLRHYATLAIDGNIDQIDNLSGNLFMNNVASPIKEPILMSDKESKTLHTNFLKRLFINLVVGFIFISIVVTVSLYNYLVQRDTSGLIAGNSSIYSAPYDGVIKNIYIKKGDAIHKNQALFEMQDKEYKDQLNILKETQTLQQKQLKNYQSILYKYKKYSNKKLKEMKSIKYNDEKYIKNNLITQENTYHRAKYLYKNQLLSFSEFSEIENNYLIYMDEYNTVVNQKRSTNKNILLLEQNYNKNQDHIISIQNSIVYLSKELEANKLEVAILKKYIDNSVILATSSGTVHNINKKISDSLSYADNVLIVETKTKPFILIKVLTDEIANIRMSAPCIIKSARTGKIYTAHIAGIGYPAIDGINVGGNELSQNEIPVKIEFNDESVRFHLNEYVNVYIMNNSPIANKIIKFTTGISLND